MYSMSMSNTSFASTIPDNETEFSDKKLIYIKKHIQETKISRNSNGDSSVKSIRFK